MKKLNEKLKSVKGETLLEVLLSSFLGGIALLILASMITVSHRLIDQSSDAVGEFYEEVNEIEKQTAPFKNGTITIKSSKTLEETIVNVKIYKLSNNGLTAYTK